MIQLHPEFLTKDGKKAFAVLPYEEFLALQEILADAADIIDLREAKAEDGNAEGISIREVRAMLEIDVKS